MISSCDITSPFVKVNYLFPLVVAFILETFFIELASFSFSLANFSAALTAALTSITHTAPGTPDYALQDLVDSSVGACFGFATKDEGNTLLSVVANLQTRVNELEAALDATTGVGLIT